MIRKFMILFLFVVLLTACNRNDDYFLSNPSFNSSAELETIWYKIVDENGHSKNTTVPYEKISVLLHFDSGSFSVGAIVYSLHTGGKVGDYKFDIFTCFDRGSTLECSNGKISSEVEELPEEIMIEDVMDILSEVDLDQLLTYLRDEYNILNVEDTIVSISYRSYNNEMINNLDNDEYINVLYSDGYYHIGESFALNGIKVEISVGFRMGEQEQNFKVYFD
ncbi:hypothetical protein CI105_06245 [Candidatus Izimaplasma bacterium ZiA1]|uniref:hypothetical protein n=1 Tax=Candidatus Izimoplasma sp. ZiA1 TaxID=2024899 RepID=UPI000BAA3C10|nr:hypothetical protein CI105_06245 [Candidatus Izimaplasma bacterium ZiA1]